MRLNEFYFECLVESVNNWAEDRGLIFPDNATTQVMKAMSELGELADAQIKQDFDEQRDAVGDVLVCLINYCACMNYDIVSCLETAYNEIKDRKGKTNENGTFVKE